MTIMNWSWSRWSWCSGLTQGFPKTKGVRWFNVFVFTLTPICGLYGILYVDRSLATISFSVAYYIFSMLGMVSST